MPANRWDDHEAARWQGDLGQRAYTSRLLGRDPNLVLHGGGNTSVKSTRTSVFGEEVDVLLVKGSGSDLADIDESGFACLDLARVARLAELEALADTTMAAELLASALTPGGPAPSVEAILHTLLPYRYVDHTHADAVVTLTNTPAADRLLAEVYGERIVVIPYVMPGFLLARLCAQRVQEVAAPGVLGMVLKNHGIFTWGDSARESYDRMIELVGLAEARLRELVTEKPISARPSVTVLLSRRRAELRQRISEAAGAPMVMSSHTDDDVMAYVTRPDLADIAQRGTVTPDHVIRTKPWPMVGTDVDGFVARYRRYFDEHRHRSPDELHRVDPAPRVVLDPELGLCCVGTTARDARIAEDISRHTMQVVLDATALGGYQPVAIADLFDVEYWSLEQAKLGRRPAPRPLAGQVALVTGAASGIGRACAAALMAEGAAVVGVDLDPEVKATFEGDQWLGIEADVTADDAPATLTDRAVERFGGLDILVLNAGIFPPGSPIADLDSTTWRRVMAVNLDANAAVLHAAYPYLRLAPASGGGRVVVIGSKNVPAPGPGVAAYSASKAALTQLARVAALEWGADGIRVNVVHPNAVFDTGVWSADILAERAAHYGLSVDDYRTNNVLRTEITSADVARLCVALCGPAFAKTTGAQVPIDGGNDRVI